MITEKPALVLFHATWCPHCRALYPAFDKAERKIAPYMAVFRCDIDDKTSPAIARKYGISSYPTILLIQANGRVRRYAGNRTADDIVRFALST